MVGLSEVIFNLYHFSIFYPIASKTEGHGIVKRNALQLCNLINRFADRSCWKYNPYGCFCGYGQEGTQPLDTADK